MTKKRSLLIVVSAPSGAGKTTLCDWLRDRHPEIAYSISCTTRAPRGEERDGVDYIFLDEAEFEARIARGEFLEHAIVHGHRYGTLRKTVSEALEAGRSVLLDIDVQGARQVSERSRGNELAGALVDVFIAPPSMSVLEARLRGRAEDDEAAMTRRLENAKGEMDCTSEFKYVVVNDDLDRACRELEAIVEREWSTNG